MIQIVAAIIEDNGKFLLGKRALTKKNAPGFWAPISGKMEPGESQEQALAREVYEEVDLEVLPLEKIAEFEAQDGFPPMHWWKVKILKGTAKIKNAEHSELRWFTREQLSQLSPIMPKDQKILLEI